MLYVLEHLADPVAALRKAEKEMAPGGLVFLELPDDSVFGERDPDHPSFASCHRWCFSPKHAAAMVERAGLRIQALQRYATRRGQAAIMALAGRAV